jgi:polysaccharide deacetylase 2 family uncharacterized protein YibQ
MHAGIAVLSFTLVTGIGLLIIQGFGSEEKAGPVQIVGLFPDEPTQPLHLKDRLSETDDGHGVQEASHEPTDAHGPNLGIADPDGHLPEAYTHSATDPVPDAEPHDDDADEPERMIRVGGVSGLPKAPLPGMTERSTQGSLPVIAADGRKSFDVYKRPFSNPAGRPTISVVVGGLGLNRRVTQQAIDELPPEITLSFVPYTNDLQSWVDKARASGHEVMIELPMEPYDYPNNDTGPYTLLTTAKASENLRRTEWLLSRAVGYFGVTNYQGAKYATDSRAISPVFEELNQRGLAFIHDGSAPRSVFETVAKSYELPFAEAARVIDSEPTGAAIDEKLLHLEAISLQRGHALGTGFGFPVTIDQLRDWSGTLESKGYLLAPASSLPRATSTFGVADGSRQASL